MRWDSLSVTMFVMLVLLSASTKSIGQEQESAKKDKQESTEQQSSDSKKMATEETKKAKSTEIPTVVSLTLQGGMSETAMAPGLFGELQSNLRAMIDRLDRAATDQKVAAVVLRIRNPSIGRGKIHELRQAILKLKKSGKPVYASLESAQTADYLLACACDHIVMPESGMLLIPGVRMEVTYYKQLLDKLGVRADMLRVGDFKGAAEPMTRDKMSDSLRQQYELLVDDFYDQLIDVIAMDRDLNRDQVKGFVDQALFTPQEALQAGLIDQVAYQDEYRQELKKTLKAEGMRIVTDYGRKKVDTDFSGMMGMVKMMELLTGGSSSERRSKKQKVAVVYAVGTITTGSSQVDILGGQTMGSETIVNSLRAAESDDSVVAVVLRVDSPGGSALASDLIWRQIKTMEKPVIASMGDVAASGGYYISMGCRKIVAEPGTLTGSIGVVGGKMAISGAMSRVGVTTDVVSRGKNNGIFTGLDGFTESERAAFQGMMEETYRQFTAKAAAGRNMDVAKLLKLAGGRVWSGRQAQQKGLVDQLGTLNDAVAIARQTAGIEADTETELLILPKPRSFLEQLLEGPSVTTKVGFTSPLKDLAGPWLADLALMQRLFAEPVLCWMPYRIEIK